MNSRDKGKRGEREARDMVRKYWFAPNCIRAAQSNGKHSADLLEAGPHFHIEVKRIASIGALKFWNQAERDRKSGEIPVVLMRQNGSLTGQDRHTTGWVVMFAIEDTDKFVEDYLYNKNKQNESDEFK
jgi:hypothetical protein